MKCDLRLFYGYFVCCVTQPLLYKVINTQKLCDLLPFYDVAQA